MKYDYLCECGLLQELKFRLGKSKPSKIRCKCGKKANRIYGMPPVNFVGANWAKPGPR